MNKMRQVKFFAALFLTGGLVWLLNTHQPFGTPLPPLGKLINPFTGFWQNGEPLQQGAGGQRTLDLPGLSQEVTVVYDERLVPHIFAANVRDAAYAQGYVTAMHRLWQMDMTVRSVSGRLSEVLGEATLERDRSMLRFGLVEAAERELSAWRKAPDDWALFQAYADGINAYIETLRPADYPLEYKLLDFAPEAWTPMHSALVQKSMAFTLCFSADDLPASNTRRLLGAGRFDFLFPEYNPRQSPVIPEEVRFAFEPVEPSPDSAGWFMSDLLPGPHLPRTPDYVGSNNWAVAPGRTAAGHPILCNDPHLSLTLPSIWYELQLHLPAFNAYGVSLPGAPGIIIGFNEAMAWGVTNVGHDVLDFYQMAWTDGTRTEYLFDGAPRAVRLKEERIAVRGRSQPLLDTVRYTVWGPVIDRYRGASHDGLAMRWIAHDLPDERPFYTGGTFYRLMAGRGYDDYRDALRGYDSPAQNFVFAARAGDIALQVNGKLPIKRAGQGRFVQDGSRSASAWQGFIPREQVPSVHNPARGFVSSANQHSTSPDYPYYYNGNFNDYRGRYINRVLARDSSLTLEDMQALQNSNYSLLAEEALPVMLQRLDRKQLSAGEQALLDTLQRWDYYFDKEARAPVVWLEWWEQARQRTFDEFAAWQDSVPVLVPENWRFIELMADYPADAVFDDRSTPAVEQAGDVLTAAFRSACDTLQRRPYAWGAYKRTTINHLGRIAALSVPVDVGGFREAPNAMSEGAGPSWRMIVELGDEVRALGVYPGGQSGNPGSPYYDQMIDTWARGDYYELFFMRDAEDRRRPVLQSLLLK